MKHWRIIGSEETLTQRIAGDSAPETGSAVQGLMVVTAIYLPLTAERIADCECRRSGRSTAVRRYQWMRVFSPGC
jgi:hypothetical protein